MIPKNYHLWFMRPILQLYKQGMYYLIPFIIMIGKKIKFLSKHKKVQVILWDSLIMKKAAGKSLLCRSCTEGIRLIFTPLKSNRDQLLKHGYMIWSDIRFLIHYKKTIYQKKVSEMRLFFLQKFHFLYILYNV